MAYNVRITASAEKDLDGIIRYIMVELCNPQAAEHVLNEIGKAYAVLAESPMIYAECRQPILKGYRKVPFIRYLLIFRIEGDIVYVERFFSDLEDYAGKL